MAKRRMLSTDVWEDEHFGKLSDKAKLLFISCITNADDEGRLSGNPSNLRAMAFRFESMSLEKVKELTDEIAKTLKNFKVYFNPSQSKYIQLEKWAEYQFIRNDRFVHSKIPPRQPNSNQATTNWQPRRDVDKYSIVKSSIDKYIPKVVSVIEHLNKKTGKAYKSTSKDNQIVITARIKEGYSVDELKKVVDNKTEQWLGDEKMERYLRPSTLFQRSKVEGYLNEDKGMVSKAKEFRK